MSSTRTRAAAVCAAVALLGVECVAGQVTGPTNRPPAPGPQTSGGSGGGGLPVSSSVVASYAMQVRESEMEELLILVLWRGRPGWFASAPGQVSGGSSFSSGRTRTMVSRVGGIDLRLEVEGERQQAFIEGRGVDLRTANVFLVDRIDEPDGPVIVDDFFIEAGLPLTPRAGPERILPLLRASPDIIQFLQCGTPMPAATRYGPTLCSQLGVP